jgi:hypothetical protein
MLSTINPAVASEISDVISSQVVESGGEPDPASLQTSRSLARRLWVAAFDLRLDGILPDAIPSAEGLTFCSLNLRRADGLVRALEDLSRDHESARPAPGPGQLTLFQDGS